MPDIAEEELESENGFYLRFTKGPRPYLTWQAGVVKAERRCYRAPGMETMFNRSVDLFHLLGYGTTRAEALQMAQERNGL